LLKFEIMVQLKSTRKLNKVENFKNNDYLMIRVMEMS